MARRRRFKQFDYVIKKLKGTSAILTHYNDYHAGTISITTTPSPPGGDVFRHVLPFGAAATGQRIIVPASHRAITNGLGAVGLTEAELGLKTLATAATPEPLQDSGFLPAKAICFKPSNTTAAAHTSQISTLEYKKKPGHSYSFPFGQSSTQPKFFGAVDAIVSLVEAGGCSVTFQSERMYK